MVEQGAAKGLSHGIVPGFVLDHEQFFEKLKGK